VGLWGIAVQAACNLYNRTPHSSLDFCTPYAKLFGKIPDLQNICVYGSRVFVKNEVLPKGRKFASRAKVCYSVGYTPTGYILYNPKNEVTFNSCNVKIDESVIYKDVFPNTQEEMFFIPEPDPTVPTESHNPSPGPQSEEGNVNMDNDESNKFESKNDTLSEMVTQSDSESVHEIELDWSDSEDVEVCSINTFVRIETYKSPQYINPVSMCQPKSVPPSYNDALSPSKSAQWKPAIEQELDAFKKYNVGDIVPRTKDMKVVPLKWVFTIKETGRAKARLVVVGCRDKTQYSCEETASPTPSAATICLFFLLSAKYKWALNQLDFKYAFLKGELP